MDSKKVILALESSCDDSSVAIFDIEKNIVLKHCKKIQDNHEKWGGIVPEIASREHLKYLPILLNNLNYTFDDISYVCFTGGPGLAGSLLTGAIIAKSIAYALKIKAISINHLEGHLFSPFINKLVINYPFLGLIISGGNSILVLVNGLGSYKVLGCTRDDAAGEALDKAGYLLGLGFPGGAALEKLSLKGNLSKYYFPKIMHNSNDYDFSFSGIKTHLYNLKNKLEKEQNLPVPLLEKANLAAGFQESVMELIVRKTKNAILDYKIKHLAVSGGVSINKLLRNKLKSICEELKVNLHLAEEQYCGDNAVMIAKVGAMRINDNKISNFCESKIKTVWSLEELNDY